MKVRDSGMPEEALWEGFFDARQILTTLDFTDFAADVVDFGCGYGTFTVAAARLTSGSVYALDIDAQCRKWLEQAGFELLLPEVSLPPYHYGIVGRKPQ